MTIVLLGIGAVIVAAFGVALLDVTIRRAEVGAALVFLSAVVQAMFIYEVPSVRLGGARVGVTDLVAVIVLAAATARCLRLRDFSRHLHWLILLATLLLVSLIFGIAGHGVQASVGDARQYFFFVGAALYMATFRPTLELYERIGRVWLIMAGLMVLLACARWLQVFAGVNLRVPAERYGVDTATRVLDGPYAFFLAGALLLTVPFWFRHGQAPWVRWMGALLVVVVVVLDRRTVWLALLVGVAVLLLRGRRLGGGRSRSSSPRPSSPSWPSPGTCWRATRPRPGRSRAPGRSTGGSRDGRSSSPNGRRTRRTGSWACRSAAGSPAWWRAPTSPPTRTTSSSRR